MLGLGVSLVSYVSTHSRLKAAGNVTDKRSVKQIVSTHSRLKAAGLSFYRPTLYHEGFNTQPPEGGWVRPKEKSKH